MKFITLLSFLTVVTASCGDIDSLCTTRTTRSYSQPTRIVRTYTKPSRIVRNYVKHIEPTRIVRKYTQPTRIIRKYIKYNQPTRIVRRQFVPRIPRAIILPTKRVFVDKTVTALPPKVTRITRNIHTHVPMVHERVRRHVTIENIKKTNFVHHFIKPVTDVDLGTRKGRSSQEETEHVIHNDQSFSGEKIERMLHKGNDIRRWEEQGPMQGEGGLEEQGTMQGEDDLEEQGTMQGEGGFYWKVLEQESCENVAPGSPVRPKAVCMSNDSVCSDENCNHLDFPQDIVC